MFDTIHALDSQTNTGLVMGPDSEQDSLETERRNPVRHRELGKIQSKLLTAWAFGMSLGNTVENRTLLLKHTLRCVTHFAALLCLIPSSTGRTGKKDTPLPTRILRLLKALLSFLPWDGIHSDGPRCLGLLVDLSKRLIRLLLAPHPEAEQTGLWQLSSHSLSTALLFLQQVSDSLDHTYSLQHRSIWSSAGRGSQPSQLWPSDTHHVPLLQDEKEEKSSSAGQAQPVPQRPSSRCQLPLFLCLIVYGPVTECHVFFWTVSKSNKTFLFYSMSRLLGVWQWVYKITQQYMLELKRFKGCDGWEEEQQLSSVIMSHIQTVLQATGERLEEGPALLSYSGLLQQLRKPNSKWLNCGSNSGKELHLNAWFINLFSSAPPRWMSFSVWFLHKKFWYVALTDLWGEK